MELKIYGGLTLVMFKYSHEGSEICINEKLDQDLFEPDGVDIAYVLSNFCCKYHPKYHNLSKEYIDANKKLHKEKNNNRGRKPKDKKRKNNKKNNGSDKEFTSCITFGVIVGEKVHGIKIFRKNSGNISKLTHDEIKSDTYIKNLVDKLFNYINARKAVNAKFLSFSVALANVVGQFILPENHVINLYEFRKKLSLGLYNADYWGCENVIFDFNGKVNHLKIIICNDLNSKRTTSIKLTPEGKIHAYGNNEEQKARVYVNLLADVVNNHFKDPYLVIRGYRATTKPKPRPNYSLPLDD
jgi:hypothetical protein